VISNNFYNVIDLDPFGSSSMFLDGAVQAVSEGGLLCITCTDMAVLAGGQSEICWSKYGGVCIRGTPFCHELGIRLLLHTVATCAARYKRVIEPLLCCSIDYYVRIFVRVKTKPEAVKLNARLVTLLLIIF
jgi:tRNA (guanine26-N2/guanine27-N2)-dimethyltransferase